MNQNKHASALLLTLLLTLIGFGSIPAEAKAVEKFITIGNLDWMTENVNTKTASSYCYDGKEANCDKYGRLYSWDAARKVCPDGWHLPSLAEWKTLGPFGNLKAEHSWEAGNGGDNTDFAGLAAGFRNSKGKFELLGKRGDFWTSDDVDSQKANYCYLSGKSVDLACNSYSKQGAMSVRCVRAAKRDMPDECYDTDGNFLGDETCAGIMAMASGNSGNLDDKGEVGEEREEYSKPSSNEKHGPSIKSENLGVLGYIILALVIISLIAYIFVFIKSRKDQELVFFIGGKTGLIVTLAAWIILMIDAIYMWARASSIGAAPIVIAVVMGIGIIVSIVLAAKASVGWKNRVMSVYGHLYTVIVALLIVLTIVALFLGNWVSQIAVDRYGNRLKHVSKDIEHTWVDSNDIFSVGMRALLRILWGFCKDFQL